MTTATATRTTGTHATLRTRGARATLRTTGTRATLRTRGARAAFRTAPRAMCGPAPRPPASAVRSGGDRTGEDAV
ncbi:hypothetical protein ACFYS7_39890 [Streptomyces avermitilis]|uniref:hypothetical protein n=1 Tax=Streptomyces avermitilis TaxID=33903 RepID=UPI0033BA74B9